MATSLNLTLQRGPSGPSVWETRRSGHPDWRVYGVIAGAFLASLALRHQGTRRWLMGLALGVVATSLVSDRLFSTLAEGARRLRVDRGPWPESVVDRASEDSFPASDPTPYR